MKKVVVVGGGITGCISALYLSEKGYKVQLFESSSNLAGVMKDFKINDDVYFNGPHYLSTDSEWIKKLLRYRSISKIIRKINYHYASFNDLFGKEIFKEHFAHPITTLKFKEIKKKKYSTLLSRLKCYQSNISAPLQSWLMRFVKKYDKIHNNCAKTLAIGRVFFQNDIEKIRLLKKSNNIYNELLGLPNLKYLTNSFFLPMQSFDNFFLELKKILTKKNVKIYYRQKILLKRNSHNELNIFSGKTEIICDHVLWTANPVPLIKNLTDKILDNPYSRCFVVLIRFCKTSQSIKDSYIQVFSKKSNITRIFIYKNNDTFKLTAEGVYTEKKIDLRDEINFIKKIIKIFSPESELEDTFQTQEFLKHNLYTLRDYNLIKKIKIKNPNHKFIHGAWEINQRDEKIMSILENIKKVGL
jgi:hypothetical protein